MSDPLLDAARRRAHLRLRCSVLTAEVLGAVYGVSGRAWDADVRIYDASRPWSPIEAAVRDLGADAVDAPVPGRWHLCQGWIALPDRPSPAELGHAWLWWALTPTRGLALESSERRGLRWDRAPLLDEPTTDCGPGESWASRCDRYPAGVRLACLPAPPRPGP